MQRILQRLYCRPKNYNFSIIIDVFDKKQMYDSVIMGKENAYKAWNCVISMFLTSFDVYFVYDNACFRCVCPKNCYLAFFGTRSGFFW